MFSGYSKDFSWFPSIESRLARRHPANLKVLSQIAACSCERIRWKRENGVTKNDAASDVGFCLQAEDLFHHNGAAQSDKASIVCTVGSRFDVWLRFYLDSVN